MKVAQARGEQRHLRLRVEKYWTASIRLGPAQQVKSGSIDLKDGDHDTPVSSARKTNKDKTRRKNGNTKKTAKRSKTKKKVYSI
jgi:hypothetical protein